MYYIENNLDSQLRTEKLDMIKKFSNDTLKCMLCPQEGVFASILYGCNVL